MATRRIGSDTCPVLDTEQDRFTLEIEGPVNGGRNSDGPKVSCDVHRSTQALVKPNYMLETPPKLFNTHINMYDIVKI